MENRFMLMAHMKYDILISKQFEPFKLFYFFANGSQTIKRINETYPENNGKKSKSRQID